MPTCSPDPVRRNTRMTKATALKVSPHRLMVEPHHSRRKPGTPRARRSGEAVTATSVEDADATA